MPTARQNLAATGARGPGKPASRTCLYAIGGDNGSSPLATVEIYDPSTKSWAAGPPMPTARNGAAAVTGSDGLIYVIGGDNGGPLKTVEVYDPTSTSTTPWTLLSPMPTARSQLAAVRGLDGFNYAIGGVNPSIGSGTLPTLEVFNPLANKWATAPSMPAERAGLAGAAGPDGLVYALGGNNANNFPQNTVYSYDRFKRIWVTRASMPIARNFLAASTGPDGIIYAIGGTNGAEPLETVEGFTTLAVSLFPLPPPGGGGPEAIIAGRDGHLWFTEFFGSKVGRLDPASGEIVEYSTPTPNSFPRDITLGPGSDQHLWFTEETYSIGRLNPGTGQITEFPVPHTGGVPAGITAGLDGNLWFTTNGGYIGRLEPGTGKATLFSLLTVNPQSSPMAITTATPNDILWFTDGSNIGRLYPSFPTFPAEFSVLGGTNTSTQGIVVGPDADIWFTVGSGIIPPFIPPGNIARMTPDGALTGEFPTPSRGSDPASITVGPDGFLWFTEFRAAKVGRIGHGGTFSVELPVGLGTDPGGITTGPDGNIWFTYVGGIGKIALS